MSNSISDSKDVFKFVKVEDFFRNYRSWNTLDEVHSHTFDPKKRTLSLEFKQSNDEKCVMLMHIPRKDTFRLRFNPGKVSAESFTPHHSRSVVMDTFAELSGLIDKFNITYDFDDQKRTVQIVTKDTCGLPFMKITIDYSPFFIAVFGYASDHYFQVMTTACPGIYYIKNGNEDYSLIQVVTKPATSRFVGFGEHGGLNFFKNVAQLTYFNYDNMRYRQVYNRGPFEHREPLYHSNPFFMEFNGVPDEDSTYGIFIDNPSQIFMDIGYLNSSRFMLGTRFGDLDYYFFLGQNCSDIMNAFTSIVGRPKLVPRYALGYHQGCYGYEDREDLESVACNYRTFQIPIDGLHIDVDIQNKYQTFTIDESKFPNPKEMFAGLKDKGFKCSTNITPIISKDDPNYKTYVEGLERGYFVKDIRYDPDDPDGKRYQDYDCGVEKHYDFIDPENTYNSGKPFIGEVFYGYDLNGNPRGTTGHYPDLGREEVRVWWGKQYQYLFDMGLEMVWQDMTTPCIPRTRGDMRSFPFRLMVTDDHELKDTISVSPAIKAWNLYSYNLHKATYNGINLLPGRENRRSFIIGRGSFTGMHRFAALWTGDNASSWDFLQININQVLALGLSGEAICGMDIGGFESESDWQRWVDPELLIRWIAMGAFLPWFRNHYIAKGRKNFQEPYAYQSVNLDEWNVPKEARHLYSCVLPICKHYIELRYRFLQLFYDAMFENTLNGMPICRPLFLNDNSDKALFNDLFTALGYEFFVRNDLLVAPILQKEAMENGYGKRDIYLPAGSDWYAFVDNRKPLSPPVEGGSIVHDFDAHIDDSHDHIDFVVPIYIRTGAIIPTIELEQFVGELNSKGLPNPVTINIYPGESGLYTMYLDNGISRSSAPKDAPQYRMDKIANSEYREVKITHKYLSAKTREIKVERVHDNYTPKWEKYFYIAILHDPAEVPGYSGSLESVSISDQKIKQITGDTPERRASQLSSMENDAWYYNENINISFIKIFDNSPSIVIRAEYPYPQAPWYYTNRFLWKLAMERSLPGD
jgi:alpha-glucosidase